MKRTLVFNSKKVQKGFMITKEPEILRRGKIFHKRIQSDWRKKSKDGRLFEEYTIQFSKKLYQNRKRMGRLDLFINELGDYISIIEIKSTNWDKVKEKNIKKLLASHRRQVWKYIEEYVDYEKINVCAGIIYPHSPKKGGLKKWIEDYLWEFGLQVVWYYE